ncbi:hypothetical protein EAY01_24890, partial [Vibrio anguillarum]|nr:hypothetical protein [Vibrio anguillarum]
NKAFKSDSQRSAVSLRSSIAKRRSHLNAALAVPVIFNRYIMKIDITTEPKQSDIDEIRLGLRKHNTPFLKDIYHTEFACYSHDDHGEKLGGLVGEIWGQWLLVKFLWVDSEHSSKGL